MKSLHFEAEIEIIGVNPYVLVSASQAAELQKDWKKPLPVLVQINGYPKKKWRINMMPRGDGSFYLYLAGVVRKASKTKVGDRVVVDLSFDSDYKSGPENFMPEWFTAALDENILAKSNWAKLTPSRQKEVARYLSNLKSKEAIKRNLKKALEVITGKEGRFMARTWKDGV